MRVIQFILVWILLAIYGVGAAAEEGGLFTAAAQGDLTVLERLIADKANLNATHPLTGHTAWQVARLHGRVEAAEMLAKAGADTKRPFPPPADALDRVMRAAVPPQGPGLALLVARDGNILFEKGYGLADMAQKRAITSQTHFRIGSLTKQFTAAAILLCEEDGKLKTTDTLDKFFPGFPRGERITLHHLLTHTSGIRNFTELPDFKAHVTEPRTPEQMINTFRDAPPTSEPGTEWLYSNSGYLLLGEIVRQAGGRSYVDLLRERIFTAAGMTNTGAHRPDSNLLDEALGYTIRGKIWEPALNWHMSQVGGAGEIYSTVGDLFRWDEALFNGKALSAASLKKAFTPLNLEGKSENGGMGKTYGYGLVIAESRGLKTVGHTGGLDGFSSKLVRYPDQKVTIVALANTLTPVGVLSTDEAINIAARQFLWEQMAPQPCFHEKPIADGAILTDYVGAFDFKFAGVMHFRAENGKLQVSLAARPWATLRPSGKDSFREDTADATFEFQRDGNAGVSAVKLLQRGAKLMGQKFSELKEGQLDPEKLAQLAGTYDVEGGKFELRLSVNKQSLVGSVSPQPELEFIPVDGAVDHLFSHALHVEIEFKRDKDGKTLEMILHQNGGSVVGKRIESSSK